MTKMEIIPPPTLITKPSYFPALAQNQQIFHRPSPFHIINKFNNNKNQAFNPPWSIRGSALSTAWLSGHIQSGSVAAGLFLTSSKASSRFFGSLLFKPWTVRRNLAVHFLTSILRMFCPLFSCGLKSSKRGQIFIPVLLVTGSATPSLMTAALVVFSPKVRAT